MPDHGGKKKTDDRSPSRQNGVSKAPSGEAVNTRYTEPERNTGCQCVSGLSREESEDGALLCQLVSFKLTL